MHIKSQHTYIMDRSQLSVSQAASEVYSCYKNSLVQTCVDLCLSAQVLLRVICQTRPFLIYTVNSLSDRTTQHASNSLQCIFTLSLSSEPALILRHWEYNRWCLPLLWFDAILHRSAIVVLDCTQTLQLLRTTAEAESEAVAVLQHLFIGDKKGSAWTALMFHPPKTYHRHSETCECNV